MVKVPEKWKLILPCESEAVVKGVSVCQRSWHSSINSDNHEQQNEQKLQLWASSQERVLLQPDCVRAHGLNKQEEV